MLDDWLDEPGEVAPEDRWGSPERDLPTVPSVGDGTPGEVDPEAIEADVDPALLGLWWRSVALANVALGGVALGLLLVGFRRMWLAGGAAAALGLLAGLRLAQHYRTFQARAAEGAYDHPGDADAPSGAAAEGPAEAADDPGTVGRRSADAAADDAASTAGPEPVGDRRK